jgi:hypothetical protein
MSRDASELMLPPAFMPLLLLYSSDTRAGETREGVPVLLSSATREEDIGEGGVRADDCIGRQADRKEGALRRWHCMCHMTGTS